MNTILTLGLVAGVGYFLYTGDLQKWLDGLSGQVNEMLKTAQPPTGGGGAPMGPMPMGPSGPISGGGTCPGGETCVEDDQGRFDCDGPKPDAYEATWCGSCTGDRLTIKMYGPKHSGNSCCWCILSVDNGQFIASGEGPHPHSNCDNAKGGSMGSSTNGCVKAVMEPGPKMTGYGLVGGQWKQLLSHTGPCGCDQKASKKTGDQVTFRCDGNFQTKCATVRPLGGRPVAGAVMAPGAAPVRVGYNAYDYEFMPHVASVDENYTFNRLENAYSPDYFTGAGPITPATPQPKSWEHVYKAKPKPVLKSRFSPKTTYRPIRGQQTRQGSQVRQQHARTVAQWKSVSDIPPATRRAIANTWIARARRLAIARLAAIINARRRSGYQTVGYSGGFGGTIAPTVPGVTGAIGANTYSAYEEGMGLKPATNESRLSAAQKGMSNTADGAIQDFINCKGNEGCRAAAVRKFDQIITTNATSVANGLPQLRGQFDPSQSAV